MTADAPASTEGAKLPLAAGEAGDDSNGSQRESQALARQAHTATLSVSYPTPESAALVEASLRPEVDRLDDDRAGASVEREATAVEITVTATDLVALRAGTASWSRLLAVAEQVAGLDGGEDVASA